MYGTVISASAFMMRGSEVCDEILHGMSFRVLGHGRGRMTYHIETDYGYRGDISGKDVMLSEKLTDANGANANFYRPDCMVSGMFADVLTAPSVRSAILKTLLRGCMVRVMGDVVNEFMLIELADGIRGYIRAAFVQEAGRQVKSGRRWKQGDEQTLRKSLLDSAMCYIGTQYRWGGKSPLGIDCSGLCFMAYRENGITIYRDATIKPGYAIHEISREKMKPADLAFLPGHVAMYAGGGLFVHSSVRNNGVAVDRLEGYPLEEMVVGSVF